MFQSVINRASLGRAGQIGALYDVRTESFLHDSLFGSRIDSETVDTMELGDTSIEFVMSDSIQEKFHKLDIEAELQVSLLAGLVKLSGSGAYLNEEKKSARAQTMSLIYRIRTVNEEFMLRQNKGRIDTELLMSINDSGLAATHVVVGIDWGAICSITCECENSDEKAVTAVKGALSAQLETLKGLINASGSANVDYKDNVDEKATKFTFKCMSDVSSTNTDLPTTFEGALELAKSLPSLVKNTNDGKGVPLLYMMMPLEAVVKICRLQITLEIAFASIKEDSIKRAAQVVERISVQRQRLNDIQNDLHSFGSYVEEGILASIDDCVDELALDFTSFTSSLQDLITKIRRQQEDVSALDKFLSEAPQNSFHQAKYEECIRKLQSEVYKVKVIKTWNAKGIFYLGKADELLTDNVNTVYVFYKSKSETEKFEVVQDFFLRCQKTYATNSDVAFTVVDQAIRPDLWRNRDEESKIVKFVNGKLTSKDLYAKEGKDAETCLIKHGRPRPCRYLPNERAYVKIRCPNSFSGSGQCSGSLITWKCAKCKEIVEYGIKCFNFYCKCGISIPSSSVFRCNEDVHGIDFDKYPDDILQEELSTLRAMKEKNILILGETGVGKSTWVNGVVNYLSFADVHEAKRADDFLVLIPSQFTFTKEGQSIEIKAGQGSDNEILQAGHSATQETRSYIFYVGGQKIRLFDTPGIGDIRGLEQDRKNFDNILSYLSFYDEIHAVCILLKPNNSRLTVMFRFCIQELLARLHTSAKNNIVFCFTNARATFYQPGDTLPALNRMLDEKNIGMKATPHNYFCFDNEPFRFLACLRNNIEFGEGDIKTYAESWEKAVSETNRLFDHIDNMTPHKVRNTVSMNESRRVIVAMSKPMAEVAKTIQENLQEAKTAREKISLHRRGMADLKKNLKFSGIDLERNELPYPTTVCAHKDCIERVTVGKTNRHTVNFTQVCHDHCNLSGIPTETTNDSRLKDCACISGTTCRHCGHHFTQHMHLTYTLEKVAKEFISDEVQKQILAKKSEKEKIEAFKKSVDDKVSQLRDEEHTILQVSAKYGAFLKENAIIPYNDAVGDYLDMSIEQEQNKSDVIRDKDFLDKLQELKAEYEKEKETLDEAIQRGESTTPEQVMDLQKELFKLKHFGPTLKKIFDGISISRSSNSMHFRETVAPFNQQNSSGSGRSEVCDDDKPSGSEEHWIKRGLKRKINEVHDNVIKFGKKFI